MAYRINLDETVEQSIQRIALEQINKAIKRLEVKNTPSLGVHEARKHFKKIRALLRLVRPALDKKVYKRENTLLRDLGRALSGTRDIQAMIHSVMKLKCDPEFQHTQDIIHSLLDILRERKETAESNLKVKTSFDIVSSLQDCKERFEELDLSNINREWLLHGFILSYEKAAKDMERAYSSNEIEPFHDWRKSIQYHMRHIQLLTPLWQEYLTFYHNDARELSQILGEHNDLSVVLDFITQNSNYLGHNNNIHQFLDLCEKREVYLQEVARPRGQRLFAHKPKILQNNFETYWNAAPNIIPIGTALQLNEEVSHLNSTQNVPETGNRSKL